MNQDRQIYIEENLPKDSNKSQSASNSHHSEENRSRKQSFQCVREEISHEDSTVSVAQKTENNLKVEQKTNPQQQNLNKQKGHSVICKIVTVSVIVFILTSALWIGGYFIKQKIQTSNDEPINSDSSYTHQSGPLTSVGCTTPTVAFCGNYLYSQTNYLNINETSCSGCSNITNTCNLCVDRLNTTFTGTACFGCTVKPLTSNGACTACTECTQLSFNTTCKRSLNGVSNLHLNGQSCTGCTNVNNIKSCKDCNDRTGNGNTGTNCTVCQITTNGIGICQQCDLCSAKYVTATCSFGAFSLLDVYYTGCENCSGTICEKCFDRAKNSNYGIDCTDCIITNILGKKGYCRVCRVCGPLEVSSTCANRQSRISLQQNSCEECSTINSVTGCKVCHSVYNSTEKGYNCTSCILTRGGKGYCQSCNFCVPAIVLSSCKNLDYHLVLNQNSCSNCTRIAGSTICQVCVDILNPVQKGFRCTQCSQTFNNKSYCNVCSFCYPLQISVECNSNPNNYGGSKRLHINQSSCAECSTLNSQTSFAVCYDQGGVYKGYNCSNCNIINGNTGFCSRCNVCVPFIKSIYCQNYSQSGSPPAFWVQQQSCTDCKIQNGGYVCSTCQDSTGNNNVGTRCFGCIPITVGKGICDRCASCKNPLVQSFRCANTNYNYPVDGKSCTSCSTINGNFKCQVCKEMYGGKTTGYDCWNCQPGPDGPSTGKCQSCAVCHPYITVLYCSSGPSPVFNRFITVNQQSCTDCSSTANGIECKQCVDYLSKQRKGIDCTQCTTMRNKTYCIRCSLCKPIRSTSSSYESCLYYRSFIFKEDSCSRCKNITGQIKCQICHDYFTGRYGIDCYNCYIYQDDVGYCQSCSLCGPSNRYATCNNYPYSFKEILLTQYSCTNCSYINEMKCAVCEDSQSKLRKGIQCGNCRLYNQTHGICNYCAMCLPSFSQAQCDNYISAYRYINLDHDSCSECTTINGQTTCMTCLDKSKNGNVGKNCRNCKQQVDGSAYCTACSTCL